MLRVGVGYDVHRLVAGRPLILGGVAIPYERGLDGHSDADVLVHALMDALLGAAGLRDIGTYFPPTDPRYAGISSLLLLREVGDLITAEGWRIVNLDATVVAEAPRLASHMDEMRRRIGESLGIAAGQVGLKATTTEGLGFSGRGEGIGAYAVALIESAG